MNKKFFTPKKVHAYVRAAIQLLFFLFLPSAFTTAFSGIKSVMTQIGTGSPVVMSSFLTVLLALCAYTVVFGRFFCGYACAFGTLGDAVHALYLFLCKKCKKKPVLLKKSWKKPLSFLKYAVLLAIVLLCFTGVYGEITGWSPWDVFSMLRSGNFKVGAYWLGCVLLVLILAGMVFCERFFCRFLCPMGAVFTMLPVLPFFSVRRKRRTVQRAVLPVRRSVRPIWNCRKRAAGTETGTASSVRSVWKSVLRKTQKAASGSSAETRSGLPCCGQ